MIAAAQHKGDKVVAQIMYMAANITFGGVTIMTLSQHRLECLKLG